MSYLIQARADGWYWWVGDNEGNSTDVWFRVLPPLKYETVEEAEQATLFLALRQTDRSIRYFVKDENDATCYD